MSPHDIPFFNDILTKAIAPALWDAARDPAFNGQKAYSDFVAACNDRDVTPPARANVKRFVAGVQCGRIVRPGTNDAPPAGPSVVASAEAYFDNLPETALAAHQAAWDKVQGGMSIFDLFYSFCRDVNAVSHPAPTRGEFNAWVGAVHRGEVERPARQIAADPVSSQTDAAETVADDDAAALPREDDADLAPADDAVKQPTALPYSPQVKGAEERTFLKGRRPSFERQDFAGAPTSPEGFIPLKPADFAALPVSNMLVLPLAETEYEMMRTMEEFRERLVEEAEARLRSSLDLRGAAERLVASQLQIMAKQLSGEVA